MNAAALNSTISLNSTEARALELLGAGVTVSQTAAAIGVSESRISQLLSEDYFANLLAEKRFASLAKHNARDEQYDELEDQLLKQLKQNAAMIMQPEKIARILAIVNNAKRRGASAPDSLQQKQTVIRLNLPIAIVNRFSTNGANQVTTIETETGPQSMVTVQSGQMKRLAETHKVTEQLKMIEDRNVKNAVPQSTTEKSLASFGF